MDDLELRAGPINRDAYKSKNQYGEGTSARIFLDQYSRDSPSSKTKWQAAPVVLG